MLYKVKAYQIADTIDIKTLKTSSLSALQYSNSEELFYETESLKYCYVFRYGAICFLNYTEEEISAFIEFVQPYCRNFFATHLNDELLVETDVSENKISYNKVEIKSADQKVLRMIMLNVSQSVTLDYYTELADKLLEETNQHTQLLARNGRLSISGNSLKKYIGKTLLVNNSIAENLFVLDSPPETWEDERLDKLHVGLKRNFELPERTRSVSEKLAIVKENLDLFKDILQYRNSTFLEWIVIALIAIEVLNFFLEKLGW